jgi:hypothetical protein
MNSKCIVFSHIWIDQEYKKDVVSFCLKHFRLHNPDAFIILSGHGMNPTAAFEECDDVIWNPSLIEGEIGRGHPTCVYKGLMRAKWLGFDRVLKQRADCIFACDNVHEYYDTLLEDKNFLVTTHPSTPNVIGDLCMYGDLDVFLDGWDITKWSPDLRVNGMDNFQNTLVRHEDLKYTTIEKMKWVFVDPYWEHINQSETNLRERIMSNDFNYENMLWGKSYSQRAQSL